MDDFLNSAREQDEMQSDPIFVSVFIRRGSCSVLSGVFSPLGDPSLPTPSSTVSTLARRDSMFLLATSGTRSYPLEGSARGSPASAIDARMAASIRV